MFVAMTAVGLGCRAPAEYHITGNRPEGRVHWGSEVNGIRVGVEVDDIEEWMPHPPGAPTTRAGGDIWR
jgi:hypothetical protein